jgi:site-specific DNA recombinase
VYGKGPAIISEELWQKAQDILAQGSKRSPRNEKYPFLLARLLTCSCGYAIQQHYKAPCGKNKYAYHYYMCASAKYIKGKCGLPCFPRTLVDTVAWDFVVRLLLDPDNLFEEQERQFDERREENATRQKRIDRLNAEIGRQERALENTLRMLAYADSDQEMSMLESQKRTIKKAIAAHIHERENLQHQMMCIADPDDIFEECDKLSAIYKDILQQEDLPFALKRRIIESMQITGSLAVEDGRKILYIYWGGNFIRRFLFTETNHPGAHQAH